MGEVGKAEYFQSPLVLVVLVSGRFLGLAYSMYNQSEQIISLLFLFS